VAGTIFGFKSPEYMNVNVRRKARLLKLEIGNNGGGPPKCKALTEFDERLLRLLKPVAVDGLSDIPEVEIPITEGW
jgi:hypothetical protein